MGPLAKGFAAGLAVRAGRPPPGPQAFFPRVVTSAVIEATKRARDRLEGLRIVEASAEQAGEASPALSPEEVPEPADRALEDVRASPIVEAYRSMFWSFDVDPTKRRPAGEALGRRLAQGELPTIHPFVDAYNRASAMTLVSLSAFDRDMVEGEVELGVPREDETLDALGAEDPIEPTGAHPVWRDEKGIIGLACYRDGQRTALSANTQRALVLTLAPGDTEQGRLRDAFALLASLAAEEGWQLDWPPKTTRI